MIELKGISKFFPSNNVKALEKADLSLRSGEIHAMLGENGTGKSTLMHILSGYLAPSSGTILINGKEQRLSAPKDALALGIGMVRQHPACVHGFKVWEDCILGAETQGQNSLFFNPNKLKKRVEELSRQWGFDLPLESRSESLTVSQRQVAAVLSLLLRNVKWLIFDEPTAVLTSEEKKIIFDLFDRLRSEGRGIILITHKLEEALAVSDRITVIRRGITQEPQITSDTSKETLKQSIFGNINASDTLYDTTCINIEKQPVLQINDLRIELPGLPVIKDINLSLKAGEIVGITGVREDGLETLELALAGLLDCHPDKIKGSITLNGHEITGKGVRAFRNAGGAYLGSDRMGVNLAPELPLSESLIIHAYRRVRRGIMLDMSRLKAFCREIMNRAGIERSSSNSIDSFSGGMLQRILLAREFAEDASLVILAEAGSGLDLHNRYKLKEELNAHVRRGAAALLFSTDSGELISITKKTILIRDGVLHEV